MTPFIKICGLTRAADLQFALDEGANAVGFVFWKSSPRRADPADVAAWQHRIPPNVLSVGVFADGSAAEVMAVARTAGVDVIQWHGTGWPAGLENFGPVWRIARLDESLAPDISVGALVLDSQTGRTPGGTGLTLDWDRAKDLIHQAPRPVLLAGGLRPENVAEAVRRAAPWGVDVSSGIEAAPGIKDHRKIREFCEQCRKA